MPLTPMMIQYFEVKEKYKDCIVFFRLGDFYEMFFEDAELASRELELVLTGRDCGLEKKAPMCGIPHHAANTYVGRLVKKGYKVAICEQLEDPQFAKGIVKRDIVKIITPGTFNDATFIEANISNYVMSIFNENDMCGICFADISTGELTGTSFYFDISKILDEISKFNPKEIIIEESFSKSGIKAFISERFDLTFTIKDKDYFKNDAIINLKNMLSDFDESKYEKGFIYSCNGILNYILETQKMALTNIFNIDVYNITDYLNIDINSRRNLEITETLREKSKKGSLLWVLDETVTSMGGRELRRWIEQPLIDEAVINNRLNAVEEIKNNQDLFLDIKGNLKEIYDIERITGKISSKNINAKELISLRNSLEKLPEIKKLLKQFKTPLLKNMYNDLDILADVLDRLQKSIIDNPSLSVKEGNIIKEGYNREVDELRAAKTHGKEWISKMESSERDFTGIKSLKVGFNKVFGYYIEITNSNLNQVPEGRYTRKQTLSNAERYITEELKEIEDKILGAEEKLGALEYSIFVQLRENIELNVIRLKKAASILSKLDCLQSLAEVAKENNYCKPEIVQDGSINIKEGRHPVVEKVLKIGSFVSNDTLLDMDNQKFLIITGPNMAGKSTYMRQVALIVLMAQIGSFVPAKAAEIALCDKIFTRIGASDDLSAGKSTFMVEMWEVSNILKNATEKSLILLDEVGRGTSTYDGLSIAWAVIEYICNTKKISSKTLFATHYHELIRLEGVIKGVKNYSVAVKKIGGEIAFLRKIIEGGADESYGIEVAKLAGLPGKLILRAKDILKSLESSDTKDFSSIISKTHARREKQIDFFARERDGFINGISTLDVMNMTPLEGLNKLNEIVKEASSM